jgi:DNA repair protein SbcD/Mre11
MSDIHMGAFRDPTIRELERQALEESIKTCIELNVDFVLICGDIFHVSIPDLSVVNDTIRIFRMLQEVKIPIYVIYGSHDYTPTGTSIIDIMDTAGIVTNIMKARVDEEGYVVLQFLQDPKTGAKLAGISARRVGLEAKMYEKLDKARLEAEKGPKIFAFHSGISEFKPAFLNEMETVPLSYFPKGFDYYAGGHIHEKNVFHFGGYPEIAFPGPLFTGYGKDLEETAKGTERGFFVVEFSDDNKFLSEKFVKIKGFDGIFKEYDATGKNSRAASKELTNMLDSLEVNGKVVVIRVRGELAGGKTTDIDFSELGRKLSARGATFVHFSRFSFTSREFVANQIVGEDIPTIEANQFRENIGAVKVSEPNLKGDSGIHSAIELLKVERQQQKSGEPKGGYSERILKSGVETLKLREEFRAEGQIGS